MDIGSELHVTSSGGIVVHSTPIKRQPNSSPDLGHELFLPVSHQPHQTPLPPSTSLYDSSDPFPVGIPHHHERVHSLEQSTSAQVEDYQSPFHNSHPNSNLQWGGQEGYDHPSRSANLSRDSSSYSLSSSTSQLSRTSMKLATQLISTSMNVLAHQLQQDQWYHSASTSTTSIPRPPHSDTSSMYSDAGALNQDPWAKKQSHSFHGRHSSSTHQVKMRRTPSVPARNRDFIHRSLACSAPSHPATEFTDTSLDVETGAEDIGDGFPTHTPDEDPITMKQLEHQAPPTRHLDGQNDFDSTPRQSVAADSRRQSTVSDATIKRVSVTSEATSDTTVVSPRTSVYGKGEYVLSGYINSTMETFVEIASATSIDSDRGSVFHTDAVQPDVAEEVGELQKPMTSPPPPREKPKLQRRFSFFRSKSRSNLSSPSFTWKVVREDLIKPIWRHHTQANITRANKLELEANQGKHNPKLTFQLFPYGLHQDKGNAVTMAVRVATPDKCPPLPLSSEIQLRLSVFDVEGKEVKKSQSDTEKLSKISIFYVYTVITHNQLKESKSKYFNLEMDLTCSGLT